MKLIVWDFDGTLIDSRPLIVMGMTHTLDTLGLDHALMEDWLQCVGLPVEEGLRRTFGPLGLDLADVLKAYRSFGHVENERLLAPFDGMDGLVRELHGMGIAMAVASSKRGTPLRRQMAQVGWEGLFDPIITPDEVAHGKPHPESLEMCLAHHGLQPHEALMVGDAPFDLEMAQRAGVPSVAVGHGFSPREALMVFGPLGYAPDTSSLRDILLARADRPA